MNLRQSLRTEVHTLVDGPDSIEALADHVRRSHQVTERLTRQRLLDAWVKQVQEYKAHRHWRHFRRLVLLGVELFDVTFTRSVEIAGCLLPEARSDESFSTALRLLLRDARTNGLLRR